MDKRKGGLDHLLAGEVACETLYTAISPGTELAAYRGAPSLRSGTGYPRLVGYCNAARVVAVGKGVSLYVPGDIVVSFASHRSHFVVPQAKLLAKVPKEVAANVACVVYLFHLGYQAIARGGVVAGHNVAILGLGALGLTSVAMAVLAGARVFAISDHGKPRQIAAAYGAEGCVRREGIAAPLSAMVGEVGVDVLVTTSNAWTDWRLALEVVRTGGVISVLGFPGRTEGPPSFNPLASDRFYFKQLTLAAVGTAPSADVEPKDLRFTEKRNLAYLFALMKASRLDASLIISAEYQWDCLRDAYEDLLARQESPVTYVLKWKD